MNKNYHVRLISLLLLGTVTAGCFACGNASENSDSTQPSVTETSIETTSELEGRLAIDDELPDEDFEERTFTMLTYDQVKTDLWAESLDGDVINDAVYERNEAVSERFNVTIDVQSNATYSDTTSVIQQTAWPATTLIS